MSGGCFEVCSYMYQFSYQSFCRNMYQQGELRLCHLPFDYRVVVTLYLSLKQRDVIISIIILLLWSQGTSLLFSGGSQLVVPVVLKGQLKHSVIVPTRTPMCLSLWRKRVNSEEYKRGKCQQQTDTCEYLSTTGTGEVAT